MGNRRGALAAAAGIAGLMFAMSGLAFACVGTSGAYVNSVVPNRGLAGTQVTLSGGDWAAEAVSIRWASATGTALAPEGAVSGPSFSVRIQIPASASPNVYRIYVSQGSETKATPFEVTSTTQNNTNTSTEVQPDASSSGSAVGGTGDDSAPTAQPATSGSTSAPASGRRATSGGIPAPSSEAAPPSEVASAPVAADASPVAPRAETSAVAPKASTRPQGLSLPAGNAAADGRQLNSAATATEAAPGVPATSDARAGRGSTAQLWSGVEGGANRSRFGLGDLRSAMPAEDTTSAMVPMMAIGAFGLFAGLAGFAVAERRRSKVAVTSPTD